MLVNTPPLLPKTPKLLEAFIPIAIPLVVFPKLTINCTALSVLL